MKKTTPNCIVYNKECNIYPLYLTRIFRIIKFWLKLIKLDQSDPLRIIYETTIGLIDYEYGEKNKQCWAFQVRSILYTNGFGYIWENQNYGINTHFMTTLKNRLIDSFWQTNNAEIQSLSINRLYRHLSIDSNWYLINMPNNYIRIALSQFRLGSHHLSIERGRWNNTEYVERKCTMCEVIEDEYHFVIECVKFHDLRIKYLPKVLYTKPSMFKFINYLNSKDENSLRKIGLYLHYAFRKYSSDEVLI